MPYYRSRTGTLIDPRKEPLYTYPLINETPHRTLKGTLNASLEETAKPF